MPLLKTFHSFQNNNIRDDSNIIENSFINKKTKRNEEKNEINKKINKNKIFLIKKIKDKNKAIEEEKKKKLYIEEANLEVYQEKEITVKPLL